MVRMVAQRIVVMVPQRVEMVMPQGVVVVVPQRIRMMVSGGIAVHVAVTVAAAVGNGYITRSKVRGRERIFLAGIKTGEKQQPEEQNLFTHEKGEG